MRASSPRWAAAGLVALLVAGPTAWAAAQEQTGAAPRSPYETVLTAPKPAERAPLEDQVSAATVILPPDSPRAFDDLGDLLAEIPGVIVTRSGSVGDFATVTLRGSNPDEVRIYIDGVPLNVAAGGALDLSTLPIGDVERVEIYRGTTPIAFPESALGGIIAITTRAPREDRATVRAGGGSFGTMYADATAASVLGPLRLYLGVHGLNSAGDFFYKSDNGTTADPSDDVYYRRPNNQLAQVDGVLRAIVDLPGRRQLSLGLIGARIDRGMPGVGITPSQSARFEASRGITYLRYESRDDLGAGGRLNAQVFASGQRNRFLDPLAEIGGVPALMRDTTLSLGATATASRPLGSWVRAAFVAEGRGETYQPFNEVEATPAGIPAQRLVGSLGAEVGLWWRRIDLDVIPSVRLEAVRDVVTGRDLLTGRHLPAAAPIVHALPVVRLGLARPLSSRVGLKANVGRYARVPSFKELYGDAGPLLGNPQLRPEMAWNADLGLAFEARGERVEARGRTTIFGARVSDLIDWQRNPAGQARAENVGRAFIWGVEEELRLRAGPHALLTAQATYLSAQDDSDIPSRHGKQLPRRPRIRAYLRPEVRRMFSGAGISAGAYVEGDLSWGTFQDNVNLVAVRPRLLLGAGVTVAVPRAGIQLAVSAKNLSDFDAGVRAVDVAYYPLPGRSVFASLMWFNRYQEKE